MLLLFYIDVRVLKPLIDFIRVEPPSPETTALEFTLTQKSYLKNLRELFSSHDSTCPAM